MADEQIIKHVTEAKPTISVSATKNTKGYNYDATVHDAPDVETAMRLLNQAMNALANQYGRSDA